MQMMPCDLFIVCKNSMKSKADFSSCNVGLCVYPALKIITYCRDLFRGKTGKMDHSQNVSSQKQNLLKILPVKNKPFTKFFLLKTGVKFFHEEYSHLCSEWTIQIIEHALLFFQKPSSQRGSLICVLRTAGQKRWVLFHCWQ